MLRTVKSQVTGHLPSRQAGKLQVAGRKPSLLESLFLCVVSAVLLTLSFPKYNLEFLAWFGFVPLFFAIKDSSSAKAFFISYLTGVFFWLGTIFWLIHVTLPGMIILVLYLAIYFGIFGLITTRYTLYAIRYNLLFIPSLWVFLEYVRSHLLTGFPWALLGHSQYLNLPLIQIADITGAWGVSFLVMMVNVVVYRVSGVRFWVLGREKDRKELSLTLIVCFLIFIGVLGYGYYRLHPTPNTQHQTPNTKHPTPIRISVIQGNIPQELKWDERARDFIINKYQDITVNAAKDKPDLIIWPEAALPVIVEEEPRYYEKAVSLAKQVHAPILLGAVTSSGSNYYNSAVLISKDGTLSQQYDKLHLVPFGEYIPLRKLLPFLQVVVPIGDITAGKECTLFSLQSPASSLRPQFATLICFEDVFPELSRTFVKEGAHFLVNITNDAWYKYTSAPYQHLQSSVFRAVENRVVVVRSANTGISGFIAPTGRITSVVKNQAGEDIFVDGYDTQAVYVGKNKPALYTRYGDFFVVICVLCVAYGIISARKKKS